MRYLRALAVGVFLVVHQAVAQSVIISQYTETDTGSTPKGIEVWNVSGADITFNSGANALRVLVGVNGASLSTAVTVSAGTLLNGAVRVIGTADMSPDTTFGFTFNGNDALALSLGGVVQDVFGTPGSDPGSAWTGGGVSTANQNIQLKAGITSGDLDGWTNPSERFETVSAGSVLTGFGVAPTGGVGPGTNVQFAGSAASVGEASGAYTVTVYKSVATGAVTGQVALGGTAIQGGGADYTISATNFALNGATTSATFVLTINNDSEVESSETVIMTLTNVSGGAVASPSVFTLTLVDDDVGPAPSLNLWFNELLYDSLGGDTNEGFEIAGPAGTDLGNFVVFLYSGSAGPVGVAYSTNALSGIIANQSNGYGAVWFELPYSASGAMRNGPDGLALVYNGTAVVQFISYEGTVTGTAGAAVGLVSSNIGVFQNNSGTNAFPSSYTLQVCGEGTNYAQMIASGGWRMSQPHSRNAFSDCQVIPSAGVDPNDLDGDHMPDDWETVYLGGTTNDAYGDVDGDGFPNIEEFIAFTDPSNAASFLQATAVTNGSVNVVVSSATGRQYRLVTWPLLGGPSWTSVVAGPVAGTGGAISLGVAGSDTTSVLRVRVQMP